MQEQEHTPDATSINWLLDGLALAVDKLKALPSQDSGSVCKPGEVYRVYADGNVNVELMQEGSEVQVNGFPLPCEDFKDEDRIFALHMTGDLATFLALLP